MNGHFIHHIGGEIVRRECTDSPGVVAGATRIEVADYNLYHPQSHKIVSDLVYGDVIVEKSALEKREHQRPRDNEVRALIANELLDSDKTQVADYPIGAALRKSWMDYRQALRDLSKVYATAEDRVRNFPARPDGLDIAKHLKDRIDA